MPLLAFAVLNKSSTSSSSLCNSQILILCEIAVVSADINVLYGEYLRAVLFHIVYLFYFL